MAGGGIGIGTPTRQLAKIELRALIAHCSTAERIPLIDVRFFYRDILSLPQVLVLRMWSCDAVSSA